MIPQEQSEAVTRGLHQAFGETALEDISRIMRGQTSSLVFRIVVRGSPYLLKIITRKDDPTGHYTNMTTAAEAGIAPRVLYTNVEDKVSLTDFVQPQSIPQSEALIRLPALLRSLHALPPFGRAAFNTTCTFLLKKEPALDGWLEKFKGANILPKTENDELFARYAEMVAVYPYDDSQMVSSHNDLFKPDNILFDGQAMWLVDWEASFLNDSYVDLAAAANHLVANDVEEVAYLKTYFGESPVEYQLARFHLMRQISHLFYAVSFLSLGSEGKSINRTETVPELRDFGRRMWAGEVDLKDKQVQVMYGLAHWESLLHNVRQARYEEALGIVRDRNAL